MSNSISRLGRGLEALIPKSVLTSGRTVMNIPISQITPGPFQPRRTFDDRAIQSLAESIRNFGLNQPILLRRIGDGYEIVAGERRFRACVLNKMDTVPAIIKTLSDKEAMQLALIENLQREDLNPMEVAQGYQRLISEFQLTHQEIATLFGKNRSTVSNTLRLLQLPKLAVDELISGTLSEGHARALLSCETESDMEEVLKTILSHQLTVRQSEGLVAKSLSERRAIQRPILIEEVERKFSDYFDSSVRIKGGKGAGKIEIRYNSIEDLNRLMAKLNS